MCGKLFLVLCVVDPEKFLEKTVPIVLGLKRLLVRHVGVLENNRGLSEDQPKTDRICHKEL